MQDSREPQLVKFNRDLALLRTRLVQPLREVAAPVTRAGDDTLLMLEELEVASEELRQQAEELSESQGLVEAERIRYKTLFDDAPDAYLVTDPGARSSCAGYSATSRSFIARPSASRR